MYIHFKAFGIIALMMVAVESQAVCNAISQGGTDEEIDISLTTSEVYTGSFTRPDTGDGTETVSITTNGEQSLSNDIDIYSNNPNDFHAAEARVTGTAGCDFQVTITNTGSDVSGITLDGKTVSDTLSSSSSGATGALKADGSFDFNIGATLDIPDSGGTGTISSDFDIMVTYN